MISKLFLGAGKMDFCIHTLLTDAINKIQHIYCIATKKMLLLVATNGYHTVFIEIML